MHLFRWLLSVALLTVALLTLAEVGNGMLAPPPLSLAGALEWTATRDPIVAAFALIRVGALLLAGYLLLVVVVGGLVQTLDEHRGNAILDRLTLGLARGFLSVMGSGVLSMSMAPVANAQTQPSSTAAIRQADVPVASTSPDAAIRPVLDQPTPAVDPPASRASEQYVVVAGDSFWSVAAARLADVTGRARSE